MFLLNVCIVLCSYLFFFVTVFKLLSILIFASCDFFTSKTKQFDHQQFVENYYKAYEKEDIDFSNSAINKVLKTFNCKKTEDIYELVWFGIITSSNILKNIFPELKISYYKNKDNLIEAFKQFINNLPFYGYSILCIDNNELNKISKQIKTRKIITYSYKNKNYVGAYF